MTSSSSSYYYYFLLVTMQTKTNSYPSSAHQLQYLYVSQKTVMNIHCLTLVRWFLKALFGALSASGTATGVDEPGQELHPPWDELKVKCVVAWNAFLFKCGTHPFKAKMWQYFYPCKDFSSVEDGLACIQFVLWKSEVHLIWRRPGAAYPQAYASSIN